MSSGAESVWELLSSTEKTTLAMHFALDADTVGRALQRDANRLTQAGDKILGLVIADASPVSQYVGEHISFFASNLVLSAYLSEMLVLPADGRPGVTATKLGDLFQACLALTAQRRPPATAAAGAAAATAAASPPLAVGAGSVFNFDGDSIQRAKHYGRGVIDWVLRGRTLSACTTEELRESVMERVKAAEEKRYSQDQAALNSSMTAQDFNTTYLVPRTARVNASRAAPPAARQPLLQLKYVTRSGQERTVLAHLCCGATDPRDCRCPVLPDQSNRSSTSTGLAAGVNAFSSLMSMPSLLAPDQYLSKAQQQQQQQQQPLKVGGSGLISLPYQPASQLAPPPPPPYGSSLANTSHSTSGSSSGISFAPPSENSSSSIPPMRRYHIGRIDEVRLTKTKAMKVQCIAIWTCCGAEVARVNTTPMGYECVAESESGCCTGGQTATAAASQLF